MYNCLAGLSRSSKSQRKQSSDDGLAENLTFSEINHGMASLKVPRFVPSPTEDCDRLKKSFDGFGTDEREVIRILGHRDESQRRKIRETYHRLYNKSLIDRLYSELSGDFRNAIIWWTIDPIERDMKMIHEAVKMGKKGLKYLKIIIEIACAASPHHLIAKGLADSEALLLHEAINGVKRLDHDNVVSILGTRNVYQLRATFERYKKILGSSIEKDIKSCGSGELSALLRVVVCCLETPEKHFAEVIRESVVGLGTDEDSLSRAIVTRAEIDTVKIREQYRQLYNTSLEADVIDDTSGDYKYFLLTLLGERI